MVIGGATAMGTAGTGMIGDFFGHNVGTIGTELLRAGSHATLSGLMYVAQGGNFEEGFAVGAVSSLVGSGLQAAGVEPTLGILACGAAGAGTAALMGGNIVNGGLQGIAIGALNHWAYVNGVKDHWELDEVVVTAKRFPRFYNRANAINVLNAIAHQKLTHRCAQNVRIALQAGGINAPVNPIHDACDYGPFLKHSGFGDINSSDYNPEGGDVAVFERTKNHIHGHIEMYNGHRWVSDFRQNNFSPYKDYVPYKIYRFNY